MKKLTALTLSFLMVLCLFAGCSTGATDASPPAAPVSAADAAGENFTIGVIIHTTTDFLCARLKAYTDYISENFPVNFEYYIIESFADEQYLTGIENLCSRGVNGIIATNFSGNAILQGLKICEENGVYLGLGFSQVDESISEQAMASPWYVGASYEDDYNAGYALIESLANAGCKNIAAIGYEPGLTCHDRRWAGMMAAFEDHPEITKAGEYRGLEFTAAVENFLAMDSNLDGIGITLLGMEYCAEPIASAGRTDNVKIACVDLSDMSMQGLESGQLVCTIGGQYVDIVFPFILMYNHLLGTPLTDKAIEIPVNFIFCYTADDFAGYMEYLHGDTFCWTAEELRQVIKAENPDATAGDLVNMASSFSIEDAKARHS